MYGDCVSTGLSVLPASWNGWPQRLKLIVPGNHDSPRTFSRLRTWLTESPSHCLLNDVDFVGVDTSDGFGGVISQLTQVLRTVPLGSAAVIASHRWPADPADCEQVGLGLRAVFGERPLLFVHGHDHRFGGTECDDQAVLGGRQCFRSRLASCAQSLRGRVHVLAWTGHTFVCESVSG